MYWPSAALTAGRTVKRTVCDSSSRVKVIGSGRRRDGPSGRLIQPDLARRRTLSVIRHRHTHLPIDRRADAPRRPARSTIGGVTRSASRGTTASSIRFSPSRLRSFVPELDRSIERDARCRSAVSVIVARKGVGRNGRPNGASGSNS